MNTAQIQAITLPLKLELAHLRKGLSISPVQEECKDCPKYSLPTLLRSKLTFLADNDRPQYYSDSFVADYLLIKINNLLAFGGEQYRHFSHHLSQFYNKYIQHPQQHQFVVGHNDADLMAQILLKSKTYEYLEGAEVEKVLESSGLVVATMVEGYFRVSQFLRHDEYAVTLALTCLYAKVKPFVSIVHQDKNHKGECDFAATIFELMQLDSKVERQYINVVQDAYSLRCSPQVHGVVYDCLYELQQQLKKSLNKPQLREITLKGKTLRNLIFRSQTETLILDALVCSLNEIGHMSFLRSERILNKQLTKNRIRECPHYELLVARLKRVSYFVVHNKALAAPTNADTVIMDDYRHDIYLDEGSPFLKMDKMLKNLTELMKLEFLEAVEVLIDVFGKAERLFEAERMEKLFRRLSGARKERGFEGLVEAVQELVQE